MLWNEDQLPGVKMGEEAQEKKVSECFQWKAQGQCSKGDSCSFSHEKQASGKTKRTMVFSRISFRDKTD